MHLFKKYPDMIFSISPITICIYLVEFKFLQQYGRLKKLSLWLTSIHVKLKWVELPLSFQKRIRFVSLGPLIMLPCVISSVYCWTFNVCLVCIAYILFTAGHNLQSLNKCARVILFNVWPIWTLSGYHSNISKFLF